MKDDLYTFWGGDELTDLDSSPDILPLLGDDLYIFSGVSELIILDPPTNIWSVSETDLYISSGVNELIDLNPPPDSWSVLEGDPHLFGVTGGVVIPPQGVQNTCQGKHTRMPEINKYRYPVLIQVTHAFRTTIQNM